MPRRTIRLSAEADERLQSAVKIRGYSLIGALLRIPGEGERDSGMNANSIALSRSAAIR